MKDKRKRKRRKLRKRNNRNAFKKGVLQGWPPATDEIGLKGEEMDREREILNKICDKSKDEKIVVLENKVYELRLKFLENGRSPYVYDRFCETKKMQAEEIAFLKYQIKNLLKEMKLVLIFGSRILENNERLVKAVDFTILSEIYMKYLKIFGVSNEIVVREMVREMEDRVDLKALLHVKT